MSSYLTIYGFDSLHPEQPTRLMSFCRNHDVYQLLCKHMGVKYIEDEDPYTEITRTKLQKVLVETNNEITDLKDKLETYEKLAASNTEYLEDIFNAKEELKYLESAKEMLYLIDNMLDTIEYESGGENDTTFSKILCNID